MLNALLPLSDSNTFLGEEITEAIFITSLIWSIGAALLEDGRIKFDNQLKKLSGLTNNSKDKEVNPGEIPATFPTLFDYYFDTEKGKWISWQSVVPDYQHDPEKRFNEILVPTVDTVRSTWLVELMVKIGRPVVLVGETGTSKSASVHNFLRTLDRDLYVRFLFLEGIFCNFFVDRTHFILAVFRKDSHVKVTDNIFILSS